MKCIALKVHASSPILLDADILEDGAGVGKSSKCLCVCVRVKQAWSALQGEQAATGVLGSEGSETGYEPNNLATACFLGWKMCGQALCAASTRPILLECLDRKDPKQI